MKKLISVILAVMLFAVLTVPTFAGADYRGDIDYDNSISMADSLLCFRYVAGKQSFDDTSLYDPKAADVNKDGSIGLDDAMLIFKYVAGKIIEFPVKEV